MADETKADDQSQKGQAPDANDKPKEDYEAKYKEMQRKNEQLATEKRKSDEMLDAVTPYVDWEAAQGKTQAPKDDIAEPQYLSKGDVELLRRQDREQTDNQMLELRFEVANADLKEHMPLVKANLAAARRANPRMSKQELLDKAASDTRQYLENIKTQALDEAKKKQAAKDEVDAGGLDAAGITSPEQQEQGQTAEEYFSERSADLAKRKGQQLLQM